MLFFLLIPMVLIVVFLAGFTGCGATVDIPSPPPPADPSHFLATPLGGNINLTWKDNSANATHFRIKRIKAHAEPGHAIIFHENIPATPGTPPIANAFTDSVGVEPATTYEYHLFAVAVYVESAGVVIAHAITPP